MLVDQKVSIPAGQTVQLFVNADYLRIKTANIPFRFSTKNGDNFSIKQGDEVSINSFEYVYIKNESASDEIIELFTGKSERVGSAELSGAVSIAGAVALDAATLLALETINVNSTTYPISGFGWNTQRTVTNVSTSLAAAYPNRKYIAIQNKDAVGNIYINFGVAATIANGLRIGPGGFYELNCNMLTGQIFAIGDIASNPNIVVIEG